MPLDLTIYTIPLLMACGLLMIMIIIAWRHADTPGARTVAWLCTFMIIYALGYTFELSSRTATQAAFWLKVEYLGLVWSGMMVYLFVLHYTGNEHILTRRRYALLVTIPVITLLLAWTNEAHALIWRDITIDRTHGFTGTYFDTGLWYWVQIAYSYVLSVVATLIALRAYIRAAGVYRKQTGVILISLTAPLLANLVFQLDLGPPGLDMTPYSFAIIGLGLGVGVFYYRMFDLVPVAHNIVIASMSDAVIVVDMTQRIVDANPAALRLLEATHTRLFGLPLRDALPEALVPLAAFAAGDESQAEIDLPTPQRQVFDVRRYPVMRTRGRQAGTLYMLREITARRRVEEERTQLIAELDSFAHTVAHDLKNPLTAISGCAMMIEDDWDGDLDPLVAEYLDIIQQNSHKMNAIIDSLLLLAGVRKSGDIHIAPLDMTAIVKDVQTRLVTLVAESGAQFVLPDSWPPAAGYAPWIEEVWANYISNAIKYGGTPPVIELGGQTLPDSGALFWVRDDGSGLTPDQQTQLFLPFTRLHKIDADGHGLGLSIVRRIVEKHGGSVGVESTPGQGSMFTFTLPGHESEPATTPSGAGSRTPAR